MSVSSVYTHHAVAVGGIDHKFQMVVHRLPSLVLELINPRINPQNGREHKGFV